MNRFNMTLLSFAAVLAATSAGAIGGTHFTIHSEIGGAHFCMDASLDHGVKDGDPVYVYKCHGRENQRWTVTQSIGGESAIVGTEGFCVDVRGASHAPGTPVQLYQCHFRDNQRFMVQQDGHIKEVASGKCLSAQSAGDRAPIVLEPCKPSPNQTWVLEH
jgi:hypothetical protein